MCSWKLRHFLVTPRIGPSSRKTARWWCFVPRGPDCYILKLLLPRSVVSRLLGITRTRIPYRKILQRDSRVTRVVGIYNLEKIWNATKSRKNITRDAHLSLVASACVSSDPRRGNTGARGRKKVQLSLYECRKIVWSERCGARRYGDRRIRYRLVHLLCDLHFYEHEHTTTRFRVCAG